tara:strand:+ start:112 stop:261 length:150 start_codon:yes stop_codon:yes gene_type:complete
MIFCKKSLQHTENNAVYGDAGKTKNKPHAPAEIRQNQAYLLHFKTIEFT